MGEEIDSDGGSEVVTVIEGPSDTAAKTIVAGCAAIPIVLALVAMFYVISWLQSCGAPPPLTPQEQARLDRENDQWHREQAAFQQEQTPLWNTPSSKMKAGLLGQEVSKCRSAIEKQRSRSNHYAIIWDDLDLDRELRLFLDGIDSVDLRLQQHTTVFDKIEWAEYTCHFKGVGFERFSAGSSQFLESYLTL